MNFLRVMITIILTLTFFVTSNNHSKASNNFSSCLLDASKNSFVSLGKPLANERLGNKSKIRIGVLPFYFTDGGEKTLSDQEKSDYREAVSRIIKMSNQSVDIELTFFPSINSGKPSSELKLIASVTNEGWSHRDLKKSTWGFVKDVILTADKSTNFLNLDSVILEGFNFDKSYGVAEAMDFARPNTNNLFIDAKLDFFSSVNTDEGYIDNAVLLDSHKSPGTIAHEILHNFGLTDLYGSGYGPGPFSLMAGGSDRILNIERATLGWFPISNFQCNNFSDIFNKAILENKIIIKNIKEDSIWLFKISENTAYVIEVMNYDGKSLIALYLLEQDLRPPLTFFYNPNLSYASLFDVSNPVSISSFYKSPDFYLLINNLQDTQLELMLIPTKMVGTKEASELFENSKKTRALAISSRAADKAAADKAAADKAAADKAAADKAAADKAAADKAAADKAAISKKLTKIICVKGNLIKIVSGISPKCPSGYKKK